MSQIAQILSTAAGFYIGAVLMRFLLQVARADFYNPVSQAIFRATNPLVSIVRNIVPSYKGVDMSCLVLGLILELLGIVILLQLYQYPFPGLGQIIAWSVVGVVYIITNIYKWSILLTIVASFIMMLSGNTRPHPIVQLFWQLSAPISDPLRKIIPPFGGLDFSPIVIFLAINFIQSTLITSFRLTVGSANVIVGI